LLHEWTPSFADKTTAAMKVNRVAIPSIAIIIIPGIASTKAAAAPAIKATQDKTATNMAKLTELGFPETASWIALPIKAVITRVKKNCKARRAT